MFFSVFLLYPTGIFLIFLFPCLFSSFTFVPHINLSILSHLPPSFDLCFLPLLFTTFLPPYRYSLYLSMINFVPLSFFSSLHLFLIHPLPPTRGWTIHILSSLLTRSISVPTEWMPENKEMNGLEFILGCISSRSDSLFLACPTPLHTYSHSSSAYLMQEPGQSQHC